MIRNPDCMAEHQKPPLGECICTDTSSECEDTVTHKALCPCRGQECFLISERTGRCVSCVCDAPLATRVRKRIA